MSLIRGLLCYNILPLIAPIYRSKKNTIFELNDYFKGIARGDAPRINRKVKNDDVDFLLEEKDEGGSHDLIWKMACSAPHTFADIYDIRFLVILDEFQNITKYVYRDEECKGEPDDTLAGS